MYRTTSSSCHYHAHARTYAHTHEYNHPHLGWIWTYFRWILTHFVCETFWLQLLLHLPFPYIFPSPSKNVAVEVMCISFVLATPPSGEGRPNVKFTAWSRGLIGHAAWKNIISIFHFKKLLVGGWWGSSCERSETATPIKLSSPTAFPSASCSTD